MSLKDVNKVFAVEPDKTARLARRALSGITVV